MTDFSKTLINCSSIGYMMGNTEFRKRKEYDNLCKELAEEQAKYDSMDDRRKDMVSGVQKAKKIMDLMIARDKAFETKDELILSVGFKTLLKKVYAYAKYNKWSLIEDLALKQTTKGQLVEDASIAMINREYGCNLAKNKTKYHNDYLTGIPDCIDEASDMVVEVKSSWDATGFFDLIDKDIDTDYWWQVQGYYAITGANSAKLFHCLVTTPDNLIQDQVERAKRNMNPVSDEDWKCFYQMQANIEANLSFDDIPEPERIIQFDIARNEEAIEKIYEKVDLCRKYLAEVEYKHLNPSSWQRDTLPTLV